MNYGVFGMTPEPPTTSFNCAPERPKRDFFVEVVAVSVFVDELVVFMTVPPDNMQVMGDGTLCAVDTQGHCATCLWIARSF